MLRLQWIHLIRVIAVMVVTAGVVGELLMEVVLQRLNVGSPPVFRLDSEPSRMHVHDPKRTLELGLSTHSEPVAVHSIADLGQCADGSLRVYALLIDSSESKSYRP